MIKATYIYTLSCPVSGTIKYVGKTVDLRLRYNSHLCDKRKPSKVKSWIINLRRNGLLPVMEVIDECVGESWRFWESYWICQFKSWGFPLKNTIDGGIGLSRIPEETKKKIANALLGRKLPVDVRMKLGKKVCQYDLNGKFIRKFNSEREAMISCGIKHGIMSAIKRNQSAGGFLWRRLNGEIDPIIEPYKMKVPNNKAASLARLRPVQEVATDGRIINGNYILIQPKNK